ncbi:MAG: hypothetical protein EXS06_04310 [Planctomycetaceae bacterium]|nr:hypothetical protein [Planctomycetaceae bacterium]
MLKACYPIALPARATLPACGRDRLGGESALGSSSPAHPVSTAIMATNNSPRSAPATADHGPTSGQASRPNPCKWNDINLLLDVVRMLLFAAECLAAVIVRHVFSPSPGATRWKLWGATTTPGLESSSGYWSARRRDPPPCHVSRSRVSTMVASGWSGRPNGRVDEGMQTIHSVILLLMLPP